MDSIFTNYKVGLYNQAAYPQLSLNPFGALRLVLPGRHDYFIYNYKNHLTPDAFSGAPDSKDNFSKFSPKVVEVKIYTKPYDVTLRFSSLGTPTENYLL